MDNHKQNAKLTEKAIEGKLKDMAVQMIPDEVVDELQEEISKVLTKKGLGTPDLRDMQIFFEGMMMVKVLNDQAKDDPEMKGKLLGFESSTFMAMFAVIRKMEAASKK